MQRLFSPVALLALLACPAPGAPARAQAPQEPFRILNRTGLTATALHAVRNPRGAGNDWGSSLLQSPLAVGTGVSIRPAASAGCLFDLRLMLADGREARLQAQDVCTRREVALEPQHVAAAAGGGKPNPVPPATATRPPAASAGTGFAVARDRVMTNFHVVRGCRRVEVRTPDGRTMVADVAMQTEATRDLAVLSVPGLNLPALPFRRAPDLRRGESVVTYGFPFGGALAGAQPTLTTGEVNTLQGSGQFTHLFQISAPVQPGNSDGPALDRQGRVIGVIAARLTALVAQNVNFAVRGPEAVSFLLGAGVTPQQADSRGAEQSAATVGEAAHRSTVLLRCER